jgi:pimeloyl-ACP methyl ester carboxylesterase
MESYRWAVRSQLRAEGRRFAVAAARPTEAPVLGLHGADDPWLLPCTAAASAPWAGQRHTVEVLGGVGHFPHEERPAAVTARIADFLDH